MHKPFLYGTLAVLGSGSCIVGSYSSGAKFAYEAYGKMSGAEARKLCKAHKELQRMEWWKQRRDELEKLKLKMKIFGQSEN